MKRSSLLLLVICCLSVCTCLGQYQRHITSTVYRNGKPGGFAVVELYTSEGCLSCPKAENLMGRLQEYYRDRLYILEFHVDYWNQDGWMDSFSNAAYSARQQKYVKLFNEIAYTPQAIVNGQNEAMGSDKLTMKKLIETELEKQADSALAITAKREGENAVTVTYKAGLAKDEVLNIALIQLSAKTNVTRGENTGRLLEHEHIVRHFETVEDGTGNMTINLPPGISADQCRVMAYIQKRISMHVMAVTDTSIGE